MKFKAEITIMPLKALLDPQGKAILNSMKNIGLPEATLVRMGKHITMELESENMEMAQEKVETACKKLLVNPIMEYYEFSVSRVDNELQH